MNKPAKLSDRPYFTLCIREDGRWAPQFGDWSRRAVAQEFFDSYARNIRWDHATIVQTGSVAPWGETPAHDLATALADLNSGAALPARIKRPLQ